MNAGSVVAAEVPAFLHDVGALKLEVKSTEVVTEAREDIRRLAAKRIQFPLETGKKLVIVSATGAALIPCSVLLRGDDFTAIWEAKESISFTRSEAFWYGDRWLVGDVNAFYIHKAGPISIRVAFVLPSDVASFVVRYPTIMAGRATTPPAEASRGQGAPR
jgi:hypothetical protein